MRTRYKAPNGTGVLDLADDATVADVLAEIRIRTGFEVISLKYGWPLKTIDEALAGVSAKDLGLSGESVTVVPAENEAVTTGHGGGGGSATTATATATGVPSKASAAIPSNRAPIPSTMAPEEVVVAIPEREGTLRESSSQSSLAHPSPHLTHTLVAVVRVMPSDNSCLFTAFGGALPTQPLATVMRQRIVDYITSHPDEYTAAILGMPPAEYCAKMMTPNYWGGAIELAIFSNLYDMEICTYDVKGRQLIRFGEDKESRCILVYSGIHYDRVALSPSDPPYRHPTLPPELDQTIFSAYDDVILTHAAQLVDELHKIHYYTDPSEILLRCDVPGCDWIGSGEVAGQKHARESGHTALSEIVDNTRDDAVDDGDDGFVPQGGSYGESGIVMRCEQAGCGWIGTVVEAHRHSTETGHRDLVVIPDF